VGPEEPPRDFLHISIYQVLTFLIWERIRLSGDISISTREFVQVVSLKTLIAMQRKGMAVIINSNDKKYLYDRFIILIIILMFR